MENKKKLGKRKKYINNDMLRREILIKGKIAIRVRVEKREGRIANISFQKIFINEEWRRWEELKEKQNF